LKGGGKVNNVDLDIVSDDSSRFQSISNPPTCVILERRRKSKITLI
jgi:hypothetical protein